MRITMFATLNTRNVVVAGRRTVAADVVEITLSDPSGQALGSWSAGAHIDVELPSGLIRQYSLCGRPGSTDAYTIAVLRDKAGRGGSVEVHERLVEGATVTIRGPRNHFELGEAKYYLFLAGGIGITPMLAMARQAASAGIPWTMHYGGRSRATMAYLSELAEIPGGNTHVVPQDEQGLPQFSTAIRELADGGAVYACGPEPMLRAVERLSDELLRPGTLHLERFGAKDGEPVDTAGAGFEVELAESGVTLRVEPDARLIDVVRTVVPHVPFSCEEGYCGSCETRVLCGLPDHRDQVLSDEERAANDTMMICVGRSLTPKLVLDL
jgi:ferredoxin-NADP reductase